MHSAARTRCMRSCYAVDPFSLIKLFFQTYSDKLRIDNFSMEISKSYTPHHAVSCFMLYQIFKLEVLQLLGSAVLAS
jgi:hypothetical protein